MTGIFLHLLLYGWVIALTMGMPGSPVPPYPQSQLIRDIRFDWQTHIRRAQGSDNWPVTWADDDNQYTVWGDGGGFGGTNEKGRTSMGVARISGNWNDFSAINIWGGYRPDIPEGDLPGPGFPAGKSYGIVSVGGTLYMWVGMFRTNDDQFNMTRLAFSEDHGTSWTFADWGLTREEGAMMPTVCNFGKDYAGARDDYVYFYLIRFQSYTGPDDYPDKVGWLNVQRPGKIDLARVPKDRILQREAYRFFAGMNGGEPDWTAAIGEREPVFENPAGVGWCINVSYNAGLNRYLLTTEHTETHRGNVGIFDAPEPWGPWTTVYYVNSWGEGHIPVNTFFWNFSNKWGSADGTRFSMIFCGRKENDSFNHIRGEFILK